MITPLGHRARHIRHMSDCEFAHNTPDVD
ncbi:hypothetical protein [Bradyrhizobium sp. 195]